jgi:hypothetical protein
MVRYLDRAQSEATFKSLRPSGVIKDGTLKKEGFLLGKSRKGFGGAFVAGDRVVVILDGENKEIVTRALRSLQQEQGK